MATIWTTTRRIYDTCARIATRSFLRVEAAIVAELLKPATGSSYSKIVMADAIITSLWERVEFVLPGTHQRSQLVPVLSRNDA